VVAYTHGATLIASSYSNGIREPTTNRIYLAPLARGPETTWHYIDCATGLLVAYEHGATAVASAYTGAVYSPNQGRIYFTPNAQAAQPQWHYVQV
jgi:hypothetical protein